MGLKQRKKTIYFTGIGFARKIKSSLSNLDLKGYYLRKKPSLDGVSWKKVSEEEFKGIISRENISLKDVKDYLFSVEYENYYYFTGRDVKIFSPKLLLADRVQDVRNFGALCRICAWAGIDTIVLSQKGSAPVNQGVLEASSGYLLNLKVIKGNLSIIIRELQKEGFKILATVVDKGKDVANLTKEDIVPKWGVLVGNERYGIRDNLIKLSDLKVTIPSFQRVESLNLSVATGIVLWEILKKEEKVKKEEKEGE